MSITIPKKELESLIVQVKRGLSSYYIQEKGNQIKFINIKDIVDGKVHPENVDTVYVKETNALAKSRIDVNDIILATKGSNFKAALATEQIKNYVVSANLIAFSLNKEILPDLIVAYLNSSNGQTQLNSIAAGAAQKSLNLKSLMKLKIPVPPLKVQTILAEYFSLSSEYFQLVSREQQLRKKITDSIIMNKMGVQK